jgi:hypothetical protein
MLTAFTVPRAGHSKNHRKLARAAPVRRFVWRRGLESYIFIGGPLKARGHDRIRFIV